MIEPSNTERALGASIAIALAGLLLGYWIDSFYGLGL